MGIIDIKISDIVTFNQGEKVLRCRVTRFLLDNYFAEILVIGTDGNMEFLGRKYVVRPEQLKIDN